MIDYGEEDRPWPRVRFDERFCAVSGYHPASRRRRFGPCAVAAARGSYHGRQWALGTAARAAAHRGTQARRGERARDDRGRGAAWTWAAHAVLSQHGELETAAGGTGFPHDAAPRISPSRAAGDHGAEYSVQHHRPARGIDG